MAVARRLGRGDAYTRTDDPAKAIMPGGAAAMQTQICKN
ncbi:hypothetical protein GALL_478940 [mine drainage metagenome]|uniref:Uncharacterized protein n=1 Tax=mine drainage metagenome TaxID=410659 RepID=A0A1J5PSC2_9ZZZZ